MVGGEIYVKKIPSMRLIDIANAISPGASHRIIGIRPGEKLHEQMIGAEDSPYTYEYDGYYKILPQIHEWFKDMGRIKDGKKVNDNFIYRSDTNEKWMTVEDLRKWTSENYS
jgi:FlaA1/EpsC-like NDP-sugar epimerase